MSFVILEQSIYPSAHFGYRPPVGYSSQPKHYHSIPTVQAQQMYFNPAKPLTAHARIKQVDKYSIYLDYKIGSGCSSVVYRGRNNQTQEEVCVKHVDCMALLPGQKNMVVR
jgi:hypothetical protein